MEKNPYQGKFIVFDGLDGSGQSTQARLLRDFLITKGLEVILGVGQPAQAGLSQDFLVGKGFEVILTKEPTMNSDAGKKIRQVLDKKTGAQPRQLQELFTKDRGEHLEKLIIPALKNGEMVVSDRYFFSSFAYGASSGVNLEELIGMNQEFLLPDLTVILKVRPEVCMERIGRRGEPQTLFEEGEKLKGVWQIYQALPERFENVYIIDGERSVGEVHENVKAILRDKFNIGG